MGKTDERENSHKTEKIGTEERRRKNRKDETEKNPGKETKVSIKANLEGNTGEVLARVFTALYGAGIFMLCLPRLCDNNLWGDEAFSALLVRGSIPDIIKGTAEDVHPPLYYLILKPFVTLLGEHGWVLHGVSCLAFFLTCLFAVLVLYREFGRGTTWIFLTFLGFSPAAVRFHVEVRMYSWGALLLLLSLYWLYRIFRDHTKRAYRTFLFFTLMAAYTHYYCLVTAAFLHFSLLLLAMLSPKGQEKQLALRQAFRTALTAGVCYLPWFWLIFLQMAKRKEQYWIQKIPAFRNCLRYLFGGAFSFRFTVLFLALMLSGLFLAGWRERKYQDGCSFTPYHKTLFSILLSCAGTIGTGILVSVIYRPFFVTRYLYPCSMLAWLLPPLAVRACCGTFRFRKKAGENARQEGKAGENGKGTEERKHMRREAEEASAAYASGKWEMAGNLMAVFLSIYLVVHFWPQDQKIYIRDRRQNEQLQETLQVLEEVQPGDMILTNHWHFCWTIGEYYFPGVEFTMVDLEEIPPLEKERRYWLVVSELKKGWEKQDRAAEQIREQGFSCEKLMDDGNLGTHPVHIYRAFYEPGCAGRQYILVKSEEENGK